MAQKKTNTLLWLFLFGGVGYYIYQKANDLSQKLSFGAPRLGTAAINWLTAKINLFLPVINETGIAAPIEAFSGSLFYGDERIADLKLVHPVELPANGQKDVEIAAFNQNSSLITSLISILGSKQLNRPVIIKGRLKVGDWNVPINEQVQL